MGMHLHLDQVGREVPLYQVFQQSQLLQDDRPVQEFRVSQLDPWLLQAQRDLWDLVVPDHPVFPDHQLGLGDLGVHEHPVI